MDEDGFLVMGALEGCCGPCSVTEDLDADEEVDRVFGTVVDDEVDDEDSFGSLDDECGMGTASIDSRVGV